MRIWFSSKTPWATMKPCFWKLWEPLKHYTHKMFTGEMMFSTCLQEIYMISDFVESVPATSAWLQRGHGSGQFWFAKPQLSGLRQNPWKSSWRSSFASPRWLFLHWIYISTLNPGIHWLISWYPVWDSYIPDPIHLSPCDQSEMPKTLDPGAHSPISLWRIRDSLNPSPFTYCVATR